MYTNIACTIILGGSSTAINILLRHFKYCTDKHMTYKIEFMLNYGLVVNFIEYLGHSLLCLYT